MNLSITNECNRRCEYCFQKSWYLANKKEDIKEMPLETIERIIDMMGEEKHFKIMGGEPLLYSKIFELLELVRKKGKTITIISNITIPTEDLERILVNYSDVVKGWLINADYPSTHRELFLKNFALFHERDDFSISTTLLPNTEKILETADRILELLDTLDYREGMKVRISPMAPNHMKDGFYDYSLDIIHFIERVWSKGMCKLSFDCPLNACEVHPEVLDMFDRYNKFIEYKNHRCSGSGPFDVLVDGRAIYCSSTYDVIKLNNIFDYETIQDAKHAMKIQWKEYWKKYPLKCHTNCEKFNPAYCLGLCPAKNYLLHK